MNTALQSADVAVHIVPSEDHRTVRVYLGPLDITPLVSRVQSNTTNRGTTHEVVLLVRSEARFAP